MFFLCENTLYDTKIIGINQPTIPTIGRKIKRKILRSNLRPFSGKNMTAEPEDSERCLAGVSYSPMEMIIRCFF